MIFQRGLCTRRLSLTEFNVLMLLTMNDEWLSYVNKNNHNMLKQILFIFTNNKIVDEIAIEMIHRTFWMEYLLMNNTDNKSLVKYSECKYYENSLQEIRYNNLLKGLIYKSKYDIDFKGIYEKYLKNNIIIKMDFKEDIKFDDLPIDDFFDWLHKDVYNVNYFADINNQDIDLIDHLPIKNYRYRQYSYIRKENNCFITNLISHETGITND